MYANFVISTQHETYLLLERLDDLVYGIRFDSSNIRYGAPNDETRSRHPLAKHGLGHYGFFEVKNSPWIEEVLMTNRIHPQHSDAMFAGQRHFLVCFKDVMLEVRCQKMTEISLASGQVLELVSTQLKFLDDQV
jgi:hypothetical protein